MRKLICVGVGPGDKKYLTLEAIEAAKSCDRVFVVLNEGKNKAYDAIKEFVKTDKIHFLDCPMLKMTSERYIKNMEFIDKNLGEGETAIFPVIGDGTIFSTFLNSINLYSLKDTKISFVAGIPSFVAASNRVLKSLIDKNEVFTLIEGNKKLDEKLFELVDSLAILKVTKEKLQVLDMLDKKGFSYIYISNLTFENELITDDREKILNDNSYLSLILARRMK